MPANLGIDPTQRAGTDAHDRVLMYAPTTYKPGSTVSHYTTEAKPDQLMEPFFNSDLTHAVMPPRVPAAARHRLVSAGA